MGGSLPLYIFANAAACSVPTALNALERQLLQEQGWAALHFIFLIQLHPLGKALLLRGRYKAGSQHESSATGRALGLPLHSREQRGHPSMHQHNTVVRFLFQSYENSSKRSNMRRKTV